MRGKKFCASLLRLGRKTERNVNDREFEGVSGLACLQKTAGCGCFPNNFIAISKSPYSPSGLPTDNFKECHPRCVGELDRWEASQKHNSYDTYTVCPKRNVKYFGRVFLMLNYTDITQNTYVQSWTVMEIMATEKCGHLAFPRTVRLQLCSALTLTEQCSTHLCDGTSSDQRDKIVFYYCRYSCAMYSAW